MQLHGILFMTAITPVHNGSGDSLGVVDREIMRERITGYPVVQASSIKGVLRDALEERHREPASRNTDIQALFGPPPHQAAKNAGAVSFGDAHVLAFPVRSVRGCWVWATSHLVLSRFSRLLKAAGISFACLDTITPELRGDTRFAKISRSGETGLKFKGRLLLEEFPVPYSCWEPLATFSTSMAGLLAPDGCPAYFTNGFEQRFVLLPDDKYAYFVKHATEVIPNIRIGDSGTTETGSLRYSEYLPSETILYSLVSFNSDRAPAAGGQSAAREPEQMMELFTDHLPPTIQIGADETTGKGLVNLVFRTNSSFGQTVNSTTGVVGQQGGDDAESGA